MKQKDVNINDWAVGKEAATEFANYQQVDVFENKKHLKTFENYKKLNELKYGATPLSYDAEDELSDIEKSGDLNVRDFNKKLGMKDVTKSAPPVFLVNEIGNAALSLHIEPATAIFHLMKNAWGEEFRKSGTPLCKAWEDLLYKWHKKIDNL